MRVFFFFFFLLSSVLFFSKGHNDEFEEWKSNLASESENLRNKVQEKLDEFRDWKRQEEDKVNQFIGKVHLIYQ